MPIVKVEGLDCSNTNTPHEPAIETQVDLAVLLSEHYGKSIRQGNSFKVDGIQAWIRPANLNNLQGVDTGVSAAVKLGYIPTTKHSKKAWNNVFKQWSRQKNLKGMIGSQIRYDDMEFAWNAETATSRTSEIFSTGIGDGSEEKLCLVGASSGGTDFCLNDYYNSAFPTPAPSKNHFSGDDIKQPKFGTTPFPESQSLYCSATNSAINTDITIAGTDIPTLSGAISQSQMEILPHPVNVMCGVFNLRAWVMPDDTAGQVEEDMALDLAISVTSWKSLVYRRKTSRWMYGRKGRRSGYSRKGRGGRGGYRRKRRR